MTDRHTARRTVLISAVGVGALAACSSPAVPAPGGAPAVGGGSTPASGGSAGGAGGRPLSEIPVGGGAIFPDQQVVVTQPTAGTLKAFSTTCTHQGCAVNQIIQGHIICPCHGSSFDISTGAPTADSQAKRPLEARSVVVSGDTFTVS